MYKFAIIGCGSVAKLHAQAISKIGRLEAVCDVVPEKADSFARQLNAKAYYHIDELIQNKSIKIISVCTPNGYHAEHCIKSLQAQKHVVCESPLCLTNAAAWQLIETEKFCRKKLFAINNIVEDKSLTDLKKKISEGSEVSNFQMNVVENNYDQYKGWQGKKFPGGGALYTVFHQYISILVYLFGEVEKASKSATNLLLPDHDELERTGEVQLQTKEGIPGMVSWSFDNHTKNYWLKGQTPHDTFVIEDLSKFVRTDEDMYDKVYKRFVELVETKEPSATLYEGMKVVDAIEKIYKAVLPTLS